MKKIILSVVAIATLTTSSLAEPVQLVQAGLGYSNYTYDIPINGKYSFDYAVADLGYSIGWEKFYLSANAMLPLADGKTSGTTGSDIRLERYQYSFNLGYRLGFYDVTAFSGLNYANSTATNRTNNSEIAIKELGVHIGLASILLSTEVGSLTVKGALSSGSMDFGGISETSIGYVYGIGWVGSIMEKVTYNINFDGYSYAYDNINSTAYTAKAGIGYMF